MVNFMKEIKHELLEKDIINKLYPKKDYHTMYVVEIEKILENN